MSATMEYTIASKTVSPPPINWKRLPSQMARGGNTPGTAHTSALKTTFKVMPSRLRPRTRVRPNLSARAPYGTLATRLGSVLKVVSQPLMNESSLWTSLPLHAPGSGSGPWIRRQMLFSWSSVMGVLIRDPPIARAMRRLKLRPRIAARSLGRNGRAAGGKACDGVSTSAAVEA